MFPTSASPLQKYNSLLDWNLAGYFSNPRRLRHLREVGLITEDGDIVDEATFRMQTAKREQAKQTEHLKASVILKMAADSEKLRSVELKQKLDHLYKMERVEKIKLQRQHPKGVEEDFDPFLPDHTTLSNSTRSLPTRPQSSMDLLHHRLGVTESEYSLYSRMTKPKVVALSSPVSPYASSASSLKPTPPSKPKPQNRSLPTPKRRSTIRRPVTSHDTSKLQDQPELTMEFSGPSILLGRSGEAADLTDVVILQQHCGGNTLCVFKGRVRPKGLIVFTSRRHHDCPFGISMYTDGMMDTRLSVCCEYRHRVGRVLGCRGGHFKLLKVSGGKPCYKCQAASEVESRHKKEMKRLLFPPNKKASSGTDSLQKQENPEEKEKEEDAARSISLERTVTSQPDPSKTEKSKEDKYEDEFEESGSNLSLPSINIKKDGNLSAPRLTYDSKSSIQSDTSSMSQKSSVNSLQSDNSWPHLARTTISRLSGKDTDSFESSPDSDKSSSQSSRSSLKSAKSSVRSGKSSVRSGKSSARSSVRSGKSSVHSSRISARSGKDNIQSPHSSAIGSPDSSTDYSLTSCSDTDSDQPTPRHSTVAPKQPHREEGDKHTQSASSTDRTMGNSRKTENTRKPSKASLPANSSDHQSSRENDVDLKPGATGVETAHPTGTKDDEPTVSTPCGGGDDQAEQHDSVNPPSRSTEQEQGGGLGAGAEVVVESDRNIDLTPNSPAKSETDPLLLSKVQSASSQLDSGDKTRTSSLLPRITYSTSSASLDLFSSSDEGDSETEGKLDRRPKEEEDNVADESSAAIDGNSTAMSNQCVNGRSSLESCSGDTTKGDTAKCGDESLQNEPIYDEIGKDLRNKSYAEKQSNPVNGTAGTAITTAATTPRPGSVGTAPEYEEIISPTAGESPGLALQRLSTRGVSGDGRPRTPAPTAVPPPPPGGVESESEYDEINPDLKKEGRVKTGKEEREYI